MEFTVRGEKKIHEAFKSIKSTLHRLGWKQTGRSHLAQTVKAYNSTAPEAQWPALLELLSMDAAQTHEACSGATAGSPQPSRIFWNQKCCQGTAYVLKLPSQGACRSFMLPPKTSHIWFLQMPRSGCTPALLLPLQTWAGPFCIHFYSAHSIHNPGTYIPDQATRNAPTIIPYLQKFLASDFRDTV